MYQLCCVSHSGQLHWLAIPEISSMPKCVHYTPMHAHTHIHPKAISHALYTTSHLWNTHTCSHVIAALGLLSPPQCARATIHSVSMHSLSSLPCLETTPLQPSVTTAVYQLSACPTAVTDEAQTQGVFRDFGPASPSLPTIPPTSPSLKVSVFHFFYN